jgi:hypothetical protein
MIAIGTCSKFPRRLVGQRVRVVHRESPRPGESGMLYGVSGLFALPHDGLGEGECVHVAEDSSFSVRFDDGDIWHGYRPWALELVQ